MGTLEAVLGQQLGMRVRRKKSGTQEPACLVDHRGDVNYQSVAIRSPHPPTYKPPLFDCCVYTIITISASALLHSTHFTD